MTAARTNDFLLCAFDASLGGLLSFPLGALLVRHPLLQNLTHLVYDALPLAAAFLLADNRRMGPKPVRLVPLYISMLLLATVTYRLYPAAGPAFAYSQWFPLNPPTTAEIFGNALVPVSAPKNAMPSLHFGAVLVLIWNTRTWRRPARYAALGFALATAFATLALGQHYLIDLVVAFPYVAALQAVWTTAILLRSPRRLSLIAVGPILVAAWLVALRFAIPVFLNIPFLAWASVTATVAIVVALERNLSRSVLSIGGSAAGSALAARPNGIVQNLILPVPVVPTPFATCASNAAILDASPDTGNTARSRKFPPTVDPAK
jgi:membrane-associated phospholipid phosphatase